MDIDVSMDDETADQVSETVNNAIEEAMEGLEEEKEDMTEEEAEQEFKNRLKSAFEQANQELPDDVEIDHEGRVKPSSEVVEVNAFPEEDYQERTSDEEYIYMGKVNEGEECTCKKCGEEIQEGEELVIYKPTYDYLCQDCKGSQDIAETL